MQRYKQNLNVKDSLPRDVEGFIFKESEFCDIPSVLVTAGIATNWSSENMNFRSLISAQDGTVLSCGFKKFMNHGEKPDLYPRPEDFNDWIIEDKIDGSLLIADHVNGQFSMRTRGTFSYRTLENMKDFNEAAAMYPRIQEFLHKYPEYSLLFEITTPNNIIVIHYGEVDLTFIGAIDKRTLASVPADELDIIAKKVGVSRPRSYKLEDFNASCLSDLVREIDVLVGTEGVVVSYNNGQNRIKIKSAHYLAIHRLKSNITNLNSIFELYESLEFPDSAEAMIAILSKDYDFETMVSAKKLIEEFYEKRAEFANMVVEVNLFIEVNVKPLDKRKYQATVVMDRYKDAKAWLRPLAFNILDNKRDLNKFLKIYINE